MMYLHNTMHIFPDPFRDFGALPGLNEDVLFSQCSLPRCSAAMKKVIDIGYVVFWKTFSWLFHGPILLFHFLRFV